MNELEIIEALRKMERDSELLTEPGFELGILGEEPQLVDFRKKHLAYLQGHPKVDPKNYLANLRTMIKKRT